MRSCDGKGSPPLIDTRNPRSAVGVMLALKSMAKGVDKRKGQERKKYRALASQ